MTKPDEAKLNGLRRSLLKALPKAEAGEKIYIVRARSLMAQIAAMR